MPSRIRPRNGKSPLSPARAAVALRARAWLRAGGKLPRRPDVTLPLEKQLGRVVGAWLESEVLRLRQRTDAAKPKARRKPLRVAVTKIAAEIERKGRAAANTQVRAITPELWAVPIRGKSGEIIGTLMHRAVAEVAKIAQVSGSVRNMGAYARTRGQSIGEEVGGQLAAEFERARQVEVGIVKYVWRIINSPVGDERVRPGHRALDGSTQSWDKPPVTDATGYRAHPGEPRNCRCRAEPAAASLVAAVNRAG